MSRHVSGERVALRKKNNRSFKLEALEARMMMAFDTVAAAFSVLEDPNFESTSVDYAYYAFEPTPIDAPDNSIAGDSGADGTGPGEVGDAPTVATPITARTSSSGAVTSTKVSLRARGADDGGERHLRYRWEVLSQPDGSDAWFRRNNTNSAKNTELQFGRVGDYTIGLTIVDRNGESVSTQQTITVAPVVRSVVANYQGASIRNNATVRTFDAAHTLTYQAYDQFGELMELPEGSVATMRVKPRDSSPQVTFEDGRASINFDQTGRYTFQVSTPERRNFRVRFDIQSRVESLEIVAPTTQLDLRERVSLKVSGTDQFGNTIARMPRATWSVTSGARITTSGRFTAPAVAGSFTVTATLGNLSSQVTLNVGAPQSSDDLNSLVQTYYADGSIDREDMIAILRAAGIDNEISSLELTQLRSLVSQADTYNIPEYVEVLASNVVNSNPANALFQGTTLGNLTAGSNAAHLERLIGKWFFGTDRPQLMQVSGVSTITYASAAGPLFNNSPSFNDQRQGLVGDCYLIASLGAIALVNPDAIENMFIDNGDGTFTIRFYAGSLSPSQNGFVSGVGTADYVTVDRMLPAYGNGTFFAYSNLGRAIASTTTPLWIALAEKAYAQWNETGRAGQDGTNRFAGIEGGWMGTVYAQILGYNSANFAVSSASSKSTLINRLNSGHAVTIGTIANAPDLVEGHAYTVTSYDAATDRFTLFNPWGTQHPSGPMTWAQIQANCDWFSTIDPRNTVAPDVHSSNVPLWVAHVSTHSDSSHQLEWIDMTFDTQLAGSTDTTTLTAESDNRSAAPFSWSEDQSSSIDDLFATTDVEELTSSESARELARLEIFTEIEALLAEALS